MEEKSRKRKKFLYLYLIALMFIFSALFMGMIYYILNGGEDIENIIMIFTIFVSIISGCVTLILSIVGNVRFSKANKKNLENYELEINKLIHDDMNLDVLERMKINLVDIKEYYNWSRRQAKLSFLLAIVMCVIGMLLLIASLILPIFFNFNIQTSIFPALGGIITEIVATSSLIVYKSSLKQLNYYHQSLHEDERFLSSISLLNLFDNKQYKDEMLREIIKNEITLNLKYIESYKTH